MLRSSLRPVSILRTHGLASALLLVAAFAQAAAPAKAPPGAPPRLAPSTAPAPAAPSILPGDAELQRIVDDRVIAYRDSVGLIVGVVEPAGRRIFARGPAQVGNDDQVDGETIYEIGGISKVFTALLLADMAHRGEVSLNDPVTKYLPADAKMPIHGGKPMTLLDLATHTSGLPRMPSNVAPADLNNPNADMNAEQLLKSVAAYELTRDPGSGYEYSNAGFDLLALALAAAGHTDYETLLKAHILGPLHMASTHLTPPSEEKDHQSSGYDMHLSPVPRDRVPTLLGAEGMRSTANDLLTFLAANIGLTATPLATAMADMLKVQRPTQFEPLNVAMGWHVAKLHDLDIVWENGRTEGYRAFIGFVPKLRTGVVVLSNAANAIDDIGVHILDKDTPLHTLRREAPIEPAKFDNYVGRYLVSETFSLIVTRDGNRLYIQGTGEPRAELFAEGDDRFFLRDINAEIKFDTDSSGRARSMAITQDGKTVPAFLVQ
jgi:CubicO group peptidase (beta-lactamase class C family)